VVHSVTASPNIRVRKIKFVYGTSTVAGVVNFVRPATVASLSCWASSTFVYNTTGVTQRRFVCEVEIFFIRMTRSLDNATDGRGVFTSFHRTVKLKFHESSFIVASSWHPGENVANMSQWNRVRRTCRTRMLRGRYEETASVEFKLNLASWQSIGIITFVASMHNAFRRHSAL